jgi:DNA polymerase III alpha subunit (gram-positive type)
MKIMYLDVETTGLDRERNDIMQLAGVLADGEEEIKFNYFLRPYGTARIDLKALEVTGITMEQLMSYPPQNLAFEEFHKLLMAHVDPWNKQDKMLICGYNVDFDIAFLRRWFELNGDKYFFSWFWNPPLDAMYLAGWALCGKRASLPNFKLATVYEELLHKPMANAHDAFADVYATREITNAVFGGLATAQKLTITN